MNRIFLACLVLLCGMACTVPSLDELHPCDINDLMGDSVDAFLGDRPTCRALKVSIDYSGFLPGCVLVSARGEASGKASSVEIAGKGGRSGGSLLVSVFAPSNWGDSVQVEARAFEQNCEATPVMTRSIRVSPKTGKTETVTLSLQATDADGDGYVSVLTGGTDCDDNNASIHPAATELCNDVDDNCNGQSDTVELRLGQSCTEGAGCEGVRVCGGNGEVLCNMPLAAYAYPDVDQDGYGDRNAAPVAFCDGIPQGYVVSPADDCNDNNASIGPAATEICNGVDDNCNDQIDETFTDLGTACTAEAQCAGVYVCDASGIATTCQATTTPTDWFLDGDGDNFGDGTAVTSCVSPGAGYVEVGGDCNDGNPFTYPGAPELCDALDNNCDGNPEGPEVCPSGGASWAARTVGATDQEWRSIFTEVPGDVTVVGSQGGTAILTPPSSTFQTNATNCGDSSRSWHAVWTDMANQGRLYLGSSGGSLTFLDRSQNACTQTHDMARWIRGLVGFRREGTLEIHGVTENSGSANQGLTFTWTGEAGPNELNFGTTTVGPLFDLHGRSRSLLFAVGGFDGGSSRPRIYRFNTNTSQWQSEQVETAISGLGRLRGVWVVTDRVAFAVGEYLSGQNSVLRWDGSTWSRMPFPNTNTETLTSVVAFGAKSVYVTAYNGRIYRYDGTQWQIIFENTSLRFNDIAGTSPADLWVAGNNRQILHWPQ
ncbi:putative metal-binding motif-containing protein [Myxococcus sp. MxC21-1]|uniref:putative metal-binding motif-containing protein n=1 Tax=Myxococcus sp. MxC21-1 TaxID=3041439 RepID=UPI00292D4B3C|nr:putative metal-binding motif-containing protein [Myxococcus sp. MxC21-1]WNZ64594.1 putative metal-binding motif-containing protein [Myxococcus sp. MxC21-1]